MFDKEEIFIKKIFIITLLVMLSFSLAASEIQSNLEKLDQELSLLEKDNDSMTSELIKSKFELARSIALDTNQSAELRIYANLIYSGYVGIYAQKNLSRKYGQKAFEALKENFSFSANNKMAAIAYANAVIFISNKGWATRFLITKGLGVDLKHELGNAKSYLVKLERDNQVSNTLDRLEKIYH